MKAIFNTLSGEIAGYTSDPDFSPSSGFAAAVCRMVGMNRIETTPCWATLAEVDAVRDSATTHMSVFESSTGVVI